MKPLDEWSEADLAEIGLMRPDGRLEIVIEPDCNIFSMTVGRYLGPESRDRRAISIEEADGSVAHMTFADVDRASTALAARLRALGYGRGDYVGLHCGMRPETAIAHMAVCKIGAVAVTLSQLYGPDTLAHALNDCGAGIVLTTERAWAPLRPERASLFPGVEHVLVAGCRGEEDDLDAVLSGPAPDDFVPVLTGADDPALLMYTSGSTGMPKGILHGHRVLASYRPSINLFFNLSLADEDAVFWSPSDWAWVGGLLDLLFPAWLAGRPVVTSEARFSAEWAFAFMARHKVTHSFLAPSAIRRLAQTPQPRDIHDLSLRVICTGGEALAGEILEWSENALNVVCNEFYGLTEVNHLIGNCAALYPRRAGSMGLAYPGHTVLLVDGDAEEVAPGEIGEIATNADAPTRYIGYLNSPEKEAELRLGPYMRTHDLAVRDADGYFWYKGRSDDLIKSSGFRIGPAEVEECLIAHPAVAEAAVVGKPDPERGSIVKAFVRLAAGFKDKPAQTLQAELVDHVRDRLAGYKAPREIAFVESFELTSSGKINRKKLRLQERD
ncbi:MAG: AMP-binding protein [Pseudomonadota bacterium]